ncbi:MAG: DNA-binding protein [Castellaniella sp.]|nr:DNA-binding protein [Castellaniella sp.]
MSTMEQGRTGRIFYIRIHPNEDLVQSLEKTFIESGLARAIVRSSVGSLAHCSLNRGTHDTLELDGPAIEILNLTGEIRGDAAGRPVAHVTGTVMDMQGAFYAGRFISGRNPACMTVEVVLEEWIVEQIVSLD